MGCFWRLLDTAIDTKNQPDANDNNYIIIKKRTKKRKELDEDKKILFSDYNIITIVARCSTYTSVYTNHTNSKLQRSDHQASPQVSVSTGFRTWQKRDRVSK